MAEFPALPVWTDAWIADTKHLARAERDLYFHLLILMWRTPTCRVPRDEAWLVRRLDIRENVETEMLRRIVTEFCISDGNRIWQKRLLKEFNFCKKQSERRKGKKKQNKISNQNVIPDSAPTPTPTPTVAVEERTATTAIPLPIGSSLISEEIKLRGGSGNGVAGRNGHAVQAGEALNGHEAKWRDQRARDDAGTQMVVELMTKAGIEMPWAIAMSAEDVSDPQHEKSCRIMRKWARQGHIGWVSPERRKAAR